MDFNINTNKIWGALAEKYPDVRFFQDATVTGYLHFKNFVDSGEETSNEYYKCDFTDDETGTIITLYLPADAEYFFDNDFLHGHSTHVHTTSVGSHFLFHKENDKEIALWIICSSFWNDFDD